jgi:hypothetical protein
MTPTLIHSVRDPCLFQSEQPLIPKMGSTHWPLNAVAAAVVVVILIVVVVVV